MQGDTYYNNNRSHSRVSAVEYELYYDHETKAPKIPHKIYQILDVLLVYEVITKKKFKKFGMRLCIVRRAGHVSLVLMLSGLQHP